MIGRWLASATILLPIILVQPASASCAAPGRTEWAICSDPELKALHARMHALQAEELSLTPNREMAARRQQDWLRGLVAACDPLPEANLAPCARSFQNARIAALTRSVDALKGTASAPNPTTSVAPPVAPIRRAAPQVAGPSPNVGPVAPVAPVVPPAPALPQDYEMRSVGNWLVSGTFDRFGDGGSFTAITTDGPIGLGVRCLQKQLSFAILMIGQDPKPFEKGSIFSLKLRVDAQPVVETIGSAIDARLIQVVTQKDWVRAMHDGREMAVRIEDDHGTSSTNVFSVRGAKQAFADIEKECPLD
jgi:hypothetical protein